MRGPWQTVSTHWDFSSIHITEDFCSGCIITIQFSSRIMFSRTANCMITSNRPKVIGKLFVIHGFWMVIQRDWWIVLSEIFQSQDLPQQAGKFLCQWEDCYQRKFISLVPKDMQRYHRFQIYCLLQYGVQWHKFEQYAILFK